MYHDQGTIAMKLMGFDSGVTLLGRFEFPICSQMELLTTLPDKESRALELQERQSCWQRNGAKQKGALNGFVTSQMLGFSRLRASLNEQTSALRPIVVQKPLLWRRRNILEPLMRLGAAKSEQRQSFQNQLSRARGKMPAKIVVGRRLWRISLWAMERGQADGRGGPFCGGSFLAAAPP
jgi:hypothetical protein